MKYGIVAYAGLFLAMVASLEQIITSNKRAKLAALGVLYLGMFLIVIQTWSLSLSSIKLIAGWMATAILAATQFSKEVPQESEPPVHGRFSRSWLLFLYGSWCFQSRR